jgi:hypothetical protein
LRNTFTNILACDAHDRVSPTFSEHFINSDQPPTLINFQILA